MGYDALAAAATAAELRPRLGGRTLAAVRAVGSRDLCLTFGPRRDPAWLVLATDPFPAVFGLTGEPPRLLTEASGTEPPGAGLAQFARLLEARLVGRPVMRVGHHPWERVLEFTFGPREGLRASPELCLLIHQAAPRPARVVLLQADRTVAGVWPTGQAETVAGEPYLPPRPTRVHSPTDLARDRCQFEREVAAIRLPADGGAAETSVTSLSRLVVKLAPALGPAAARAVARNALASPDGPGEALFAAFSEVVAAYPDGPFHPGLLWPASQRVREAAGGPGPAAIEVTTLRPPAATATGAARYGGENEFYLPSDSLGQAVMAWHLAGRLATARRALAGRVSRAVRTALARTARKIGRQQEDLSRAGEAAELRRHGELLLANLGRVDPSRGEAALTDYDGRRVRIPLDPRLSASQNAQRYFERYRKARRAASLDGPRLKAASERAWLEAVAYDLDRLGAATAAQRPDQPGRDLAGGHPPEEAWAELWRGLEDAASSLVELRAIEVSLAGAGHVSGRRAAGTNAAPNSTATRPPGGTRSRTAAEPLRYVTEDGLSVLAGRSARENEALSLRTARPGDLWFHARGYPGSHVVLRLPPGGTGELPGTSVLQAAALAAHLSAARGAGKVSVDYTEARHLRRPKGAPPGLVLYDPHETLLVDTDKVRLPHLVQKGQPGESPAPPAGGGPGRPGPGGGQAPAEG